MNLGREAKLLHGSWSMAGKGQEVEELWENYYSEEEGKENNNETSFAFTLRNKTVIEKVGRKTVKPSKLTSA